ncbi:hypothetical protein EV182_004116 [Spiromyces aspiralis]|uniref:Uncharacterized protein n=1 Tax=Spiromyces aspiralis TaxID=68401 RepID=A0ACC1HEG7_9FUNG|nr:hypothetical protein EV182_004116 [Spiromyces aspiralis]
MKKEGGDLAGLLSSSNATSTNVSAASGSSGAGPGFLGGNSMSTAMHMSSALLPAGDSIPALDINVLTNESFEYNYFHSVSKPENNARSFAVEMAGLAASANMSTNGLPADILSNFQDNAFHMPNSDSLADHINFGSASASNDNSGISLFVDINFDEIMSRGLGNLSGVTSESLLSMIDKDNSNHNSNNSGDGPKGATSAPTEKQSAKAS